MATLVLGMGNPWQRDDGAGVACLKGLRHRHPEGEPVVFHEAGALDLSFLTALTCCNALVVLDALPMGEPPGTVRLFAGEAMDRALACGERRASAIGLADLLDLARLTGWRPPRRRVLVAIEPASCAPGAELSPEVAAALPAAIRLADACLTRWLHEDQGSAPPPGPPPEPRPEPRPEGPGAAQPPGRTRS